jgi:hypothetical protein
MNTNPETNVQETGESSDIIHVVNPSMEYAAIVEDSQGKPQGSKCKWIIAIFLAAIICAGIVGHSLGMCRMVSKWGARSQNARNINITIENNLEINTTAQFSALANQIREESMVDLESSEVESDESSESIEIDETPTSTQWKKGMTGMGCFTKNGTSTWHKMRIQRENADGSFAVCWYEDKPVTYTHVFPANRLRLFSQGLSVMLHGLKRDVEFNGVRGRTMKWDQEHQAWEVLLITGQSVRVHEKSLKETNALFQKRQTIELFDIAIPEYNGQVGLTKEYQPDTGRWIMELESGLIVSVLEQSMKPAKRAFRRQAPKAVVRQGNY